MIIADSAAGGIALIVAIIAGYFLPTIVAKSRHVENANPTFIVNLFLGWTLIGWVIALAMGAGAKTRDSGETRGRTSDGLVPTGGRRFVPTEPHGDMRDCPSCAEPIKAAAKKCRYCGYEIEVVRPHATVKRREYIYDKPSTFSRDHDRVGVGETVDLLELGGTFSRIRARDGRMGWMKTDALASNAPTDAWTD